MKRHDTNTTNTNHIHLNNVKYPKLSLVPAAMAALTVVCAMAQPTRNVVDEVAWIVGDEAIFRSDVEEMYASLRSMGDRIDGDPYCVLPERLAVEKLYLHQAKLDTIEAPESQVLAQAEQQLNYYIANIGSKEKVEEYFRKPLPTLRAQLVDMIRTNYIIGQVENKLTENVQATPNEVRKYFDALPTDSVPYIPMQVEAQIITFNPQIPRQEIEDVKARLRDYADRVTRGDADFSTLAIMYSEDGSAMQGGELGFTSRSQWVPEFANVAFNLNDPKKVSRIVETEYGYHIIQLIAKRGDQVNVRHILLRPHVSTQDLTLAVNRLDSVRKEIVGGAFSFEEGARMLSQDKDTRNNHGLMVNPHTGSSRFEMQDLPADIANHVEGLEVGDISEAFIWKDPQRNKEVAAIVRLANRVPGHRATLAEDYSLIRQMYENHQKQQIIRDWIEKKIKDTYVKIEEGWEACDFNYQGWVK